MSTFNGKRGPIAYGEPSSIGEMLKIGERYCTRHLCAIPKLTRAEVIRAGGVFPPARPPSVVGRPRKEVAA